MPKKIAETKPKRGRPKKGEVRPPKAIKVNKPKGGHPNFKKHEFKPGVSGNPDGAKKHSPEIKALKNLTEKELVDIGNLVIKGTIQELQAIADNPEATVLQTMLASVAARVVKRGDMGALDVLLNRLVGKVKDKIDHSGIPQSTPPRIVLTLPRNGKEAS